MQYSFILAILLVGYVAAQSDVTGSPLSFSIIQGETTPLQYTVGNTASNAMTQVTFTVTSSNTNNVLISYPNGDTKSNIGTISGGGNGVGGFTLVGITGSYVLTFTIKYKRPAQGNSFITKQFTAQLSVTDPSSKREIAAAEELYPEVPANYNHVVARGTDVSFNPTSFGCIVDTTTWYNLTITANVGVRNLSFAVSPSNTNNIIVYYPPSGNNLGNINQGAAKVTSFAVNANTVGSYTLTIAVQYKKGVSTSFTYDYITAPLSVTGAKRSIELDDAFFARIAADADEVPANSNSAGLKAEYIIGFGVGIAALAGVAVGVALSTIVRRSATSTVA